ncbi:MAG: hypothetical protein LBD41_04530 [Clostridiales Family XIII bacterium]|jgi:hypothetical protein|nr:hypothetical protein [Clostridiales Family XIII bacterium]
MINQLFFWNGREVGKIMRKGEQFGYKLIREVWNPELKKEGYETVQGSVPIAFAKKKLMLTDEQVKEINKEFVQKNN